MIYLSKWQCDSLTRILPTEMVIQLETEQELDQEISLEIGGMISHLLKFNQIRQDPTNNTLSIEVWIDKEGEALSMNNWNWLQELATFLNESLYGVMIHRK